MSDSARGRRLGACLLLCFLGLTSLGAQTSEKEEIASTHGAGLSPQEGYGLLLALMSDRPKERKEAATKLIASRDLSLVPGLVDSIFFMPKIARAEAFEALEGLTGEKRGPRYLDWIELVGAHEEWKPKEGYFEWKVALYSRIDKTYQKIFYKGAPSRIRLEEIVSGGVPFEGIPALDQPTVIPAEQADYLKDSEKVFGVSLGGEQRAYPLRILDWHEMLNDTVGGKPVTLSYCTLCGAGVLFSTQTPSGKPYTFGTSGLLYRSNKLMVDRQTLTLWNNLTGEPAVGRLARSPIRLEVLPLTLTTWKEWRGRHPNTKVLALDAAMAGRWGYSYQPGAANKQRSGVSFPIWKKNKVLDDKDEVFALRLGDRAKAYPIDVAIREKVINDTLGEVAVVVVADAVSGAVRAFDRGDRVFKLGDSGVLVDQDGRSWRVDEESLVALGADGASAGGTLDSRPRLPSHQAFWFGWYGFFPQSEVYGVTSAPNGD